MITLTKEQNSLLNGLLLSDGYIINRDNLFGITSSSLQFVEYVKSIFPNEIWSSTKIFKTEYFDKRINKTLTEYYIRSHNNLFLSLKEKWYQNGKKIIPNDIIIDKECLLTWYLGDGCLQHHKNKKSTDGIKLCTNSFDKNDIEKVLIPQLLKYEAKIQYTDKKQPVIIIPRRKCDLFLNDIGNCPFDDYKYKWNIFPYKNKKIEKNGFKYISNEIKKIIIESYKNGKSTRNIAKENNLDQSLVIYYCKKEKIYDKKRDKKRYKITNLINGETVITDNLKKYCKENNLCYENLLKLCGGKIKKYKFYKIEKI